MKLNPKELNEFKDEIIQYKKLAPEIDELCKNLDEVHPIMYYLFKLNKYSDRLVVGQFE
jgi:hypothetical protein